MKRIIALVLVLCMIVPAIVACDNTNPPVNDGTEGSQNTPVTETPVTETPVTEAPVTEAPVTEAPVTEAPVTEAPVTETPVTEAPVTEAPVTEAPVTEAPVTEAPVTEAPVTEAPVTEAPVTEAPVTEAPVTEAPEVDPTKYTLTVSEKGGNGAYTTLQDVFDAIAKIDKAQYTGIVILVKNGTYTITEPIEVNAKKAGTKDCPVTVIGEKGATIVGGVALTSADFVKATGSALQYMPADVQDKIVQIDLKKYGYTADQIIALMSDTRYLEKVPVLTVAGERQTLCRYPNEDWISIGAGSTMIDQYGNPTMITDNEGGEFEAVTTNIEYGEEHMSHPLSWHSIKYARAAGHYNVLWVQDNTEILSFATDDDIMTVPYRGGYPPVEGGLLYWYNIPEELDVPGEYYIDENAILYYYPAEDFDGALVSLPRSNGFMTLDNADYITLDNLTFESSLSSGIVGTADNFTIQNCDISAVVGEKAINITGYNILIQGNHIHNLSQAGISLYSGDLATLTHGNSRIYNNYIHDWGIVKYPYADGISVEGVGNLIDHNIMHASNASAISGEGAYITLEYNHIYDVLRTSDDIGATGNSGYAENVTRYNYIHHIGAVGVAGEVENLNSMGSAAIYWDGGSSYAEAYGNVIETIKGHGVIMNGGRSLKVHGNLIIDCSMWYVQCVAMFYARALENGYTTVKDVYPDYVRNAVWLEANPELSKIVEDLSQTTPDDPWGWATTYGDELHSNWIHYNKYGRAFSNWGIRPYYVEDHVYTFCSDTVTIPTDGKDPANTSDYNSRRNKVDLHDLIVNKGAAVLEITWEQFNEIGIVESDWNLDIELPALIQTAE